MKTLSLFPFILLILTFNLSFAQSKAVNSYVALKNEVTAYHQKNLNTVFEQQRNKLNQFLEKEDKASIYALAKQFEAQQSQKAKLFAQKQADASVFMQTWEELQQKEVQILIKAEGFVEKYDAIIEQVLKEEIQTQIKKWQTEINQILSKYNTPLQYPQQRYFAKYGFGRWSSPAYFLLWNAEKPEKQEAAAEPGN